MTKRFEAFIFDLDGTLLDTLPDLVVLTNTALGEQGFPQRTREEIHSFVGNGAGALINQAVPPQATAEQRQATLERWRELYPLIGLDLTRPFPYMIETLERLKGGGARLGVLSNKFDAAVKEVIGSFMPGLFDVMHGECEGIPRKPDPTGLLRTMGELGVEPERVLYVGDSRNDVMTARNAGVTVAAVTWGYTAIADLEGFSPDFLVDDPRELAELSGY